MTERIARRSIFSILTALLLFAAPAALAQTQYDAMQGVTSVQTVFDFRIGDPDVALGHLNLIHSMLEDPSMVRKGEPPELAVVFIGPSVKLISSDANGSAEIADKISAMEADGVRFEICMTAAHAHNVSASSILPEVVQVPNGWISLAGYQHQGYAMIADF